MEPTIPRVWPKVVVCILSWLISIPIFWFGVFLIIIVFTAPFGVALCIACCTLNAKTTTMVIKVHSRKSYLETIYAEIDAGLETLS